MTGDVAFSGKHTMQDTDDVAWNYILETCIISLTNISPVYLISKNNVYALTTHTYIQIKCMSSVTLKSF